MRHRRVIGGWTAAVVVGGLALAGLQGTAAADTASPARATAQTSPALARTSPALLTAMRRDLHLSAEQAEHRLAAERSAGARAGELRATLGDDFAGAWVTGDAATLHVNTTDPAAADRITARGAVATVVPHSLAELDAAKAALDKEARQHKPAATPVWYVDVRSDSVRLLSAQPSRTESFVTAAGVDPGLVTVARSTVAPRTFADLRGGDAYYIDGATRCSIGFPVSGGGQSGFVSAGHCGRPGSSTTGSNQQPQGTFQGSTFPGHDYSWVATNSGWTPRPTVNGYGNGDVTVAGSTEAMEGSSVCRSGSTTGWHCGTVQQRNTSVSYQEGTVTGVTRTNVCAEPGDSGGSFISGTQAQGVTSGGSGNCSAGGETYFQPVNPALQAYGLTLVTSDGGGPTDPPTDPPTDGTWAAGTVYQPGDQVTYGGVDYRCLQSHQAQAGWEPPNAPALWQRV